MTSAVTGTDAASTGASSVVDGAFRDAGRALSDLGRTADDLNRIDEAADDERIRRLLSAMAHEAVKFDHNARRLAECSSPVFQEAADELSDATEALSTRWHRLVESRRRALIALVLRRQHELALLLVGMSRARTAASALPMTGLPIKPVTAPRARGSAAKGSAAQAWAEWTAEQSPPAATACLRLSQSWIEGTSAQLARQQQRTLGARSNAEEVAGRLRHHLTVIANAGALTYMDALASAKRLVMGELQHKTT